MPKAPLFLKFANREISIDEMLESFSRSPDSYTSKAVVKARAHPPELEDFREELKDAVTDIIKEGPGEEFKAFVNHYMEEALEEDIETEKGQLGKNVFRTARVKDMSKTWVQGFICYNLCLYIRAFGLGALKKCKVCGKFFNHKGKYAVYCSDSCKSQRKEKK